MIRRTRLRTLTRWLALLISISTLSVWLVSYRYRLDIGLAAHGGPWFGGINRDAVAIRWATGSWPFTDGPFQKGFEEATAAVRIPYAFYIGPAAPDSDYAKY